MARFIAKHIVAAGLADKCEIQLSYAIGVAQPVSIMVDTFGTSKIPEDVIQSWVMLHIDLRPGAIIETLNLRRPIYEKTASYGHFGREEFSWEKLNEELISQLQALLYSVSTQKFGHLPDARLPKSGSPSFYRNGAW